MSLFWLLQLLSSHIISHITENPQVVSTMVVSKNCRVVTIFIVH